MTQRQDIKLTVIQQQTLQNMQGDVDWLEEQIQKAELAGLDVSGMREKLADLQKVREGLLREYG